MRRHKIHIAARALLDARAEGGKTQLLTRPASWAGSGAALVAHGGQLCRYEFGAATLIYGVTLVDLAESWQLLTLDELKAEQSGARLTRRRRPRASSIRGRPSGAAIAEAFPGWISVAQAAQQLGVHCDRVRRAAKAGLIPSRTERKVLLVQADRIGELTPLRRAVAQPVETTPQEPTADVEAYS